MGEGLLGDAKLLGKLGLRQASFLARFLYDGDALVGEYNTSGTLLRRYVHGADRAATGLSADNPLAWFNSSSFTTTATRHLFANPQGSLVLADDSAGNAVRLFAYDEYGVPTTSGGTASLTAANGSFVYLYVVENRITP